ncbi:MAG TPA: hypothetical protein VEL75_13705, partial [Candidatus Methylomirabilis sp.]|nr:hypothetical protein [Candidatus Methylomirabilis sp.]
MPRAFAPTSTAVLAALLLASCASSMSRDTEILPADARALRFGATAPDVFANPQLSEKIRLLYGPDWAPGGRNQFGAAAYFPAS